MRGAYFPVIIRWESPNIVIVVLYETNLPYRAFVAIWFFGIQAYWGGQAVRVVSAIKSPGKMNV
jgi:hypothetical protein